MKKILKWVLIILAVWTALCVVVMFDDDEESAKNQTTVKMTTPPEKISQIDLSVSDFTFNKDISNAFKTLRSKGWMPGDGDEGECGTGYSDFLTGYGYIKQDGKFEGYRIPLIIVSADEYEELAHIRVTIDIAINSKEYIDLSNEFNSQKEEELQKILTEKKGEAFKEIEKLCLLRHGYSYSADEDEERNRYGSFILGYKNNNGDICKLEITETGRFTTTFTLDYVSARFRNEEKLAQELLNAYYGR